MRRSIFVAVSLAAFLVMPRQRVVAQHAHAARFGDVHFANSGKAVAQGDFQRGIALLHSFMYDEAAEAFRAAEAKDPAFAMAYWAEALTYIHTGWREEDVAAANAALDRLRPSERLDLAGTPRERMYGAAVEALVANGVKEESRARAFADSMQVVTRKYPDDLDAAAFAALAALNVNYLWPPRDPAVREREYVTADSLARSVYRRAPNHPAGAHYLIHANDDPLHAARGLAAARAYASIAPDAEHALHMPSHIFVQLGLWDDATRMNVRAWAASRADARRRHQPGTSLSFHTLQWLQYSVVQQGRIAAARALLDSARLVLRDAPADFNGNADARFTVQDLAFRLAAATDSGWTVVRDETVRAGWLGTTPRALGFSMASLFHEGVARAKLADSAGVEGVKRRLAEQSGGRARLRDLFLAQLDGYVAQQGGRNDDAVAAFARAAAIEDSVPPIGPPPMVPSHELLGGALMRAGRPADAAEAFAHSLAMRPLRTAALLGKARAETAAGNATAAATSYRTLASTWHGADRDVTGVEEARRYGRRGPR